MGLATAVQLGNIQQQPLATNNSSNNANANANHVGAMVDPELMGQGMEEELQKMAGEAIAHSTAMHHAQQGQCGGDGDNGGEDENERELRTRLGGFIDGGVGGGGGGRGVSGGDGGVAGGEMMHQSAA